MNYTQIPEAERLEMLEAIGVASIDELFSVIPDEIRFRGKLDLPPGASELELQRELAARSADNLSAQNAACFLGGGAYDHFIPAFIDQLILRGEFLTAYTPYQAEASQGALQAFFEFQTQVARLTGLEISNASLYEGATAAAEGVLLALNHTAKGRVMVAGTVHPDYRQVIATYTDDLPCEVVEIEAGADGRISADAVAAAADGQTACLVVQSPNVYGIIEDWQGLFGAAKGAGGAGKPPLGIAVFNPISLGLLKSPGACGADVAAGEGQPLGTPLQLGGPYLGLFAAKAEFLRRMPGRLVGQTVDASGRTAYCLTLQTREQHIRGAKATSNICTNQGLFALRATMYMSAMGSAGLGEVARQCWHKAHYLANSIAALDGYELRYPGSEFFHEFVVTCPRPAREIVEACAKERILAGIPLDHDRIGKIGAANELLIAVTEKRTKEELDRVVGALRQHA
jgi:glycine dehydrogenase subunit 1